MQHCSKRTPRSRARDLPRDPHDETMSMIYRVYLTWFRTGCFDVQRRETDPHPSRKRNNVKIPNLQKLKLGFLI